MMSDTRGEMCFIFQSELELARDKDKARRTLELLAVLAASRARLLGRLL